MCTSTVAVADALPVQPEMVIGDSTVERSGIGTSVLLVAAQPAGAGDGDGDAVAVGDGVGVGRRVGRARAEVDGPGVDAADVGGGGVLDAQLPGAVGRLG